MEGSWILIKERAALFQTGIRHRLKEERKGKTKQEEEDIKREE